MDIKTELEKKKIRLFITKAKTAIEETEFKIMESSSGSIKHY